MYQNTVENCGHYSLNEWPKPPLRCEKEECKNKICNSCSLILKCTFCNKVLCKEHAYGCMQMCCIFKYCKSCTTQCSGCDTPYCKPHVTSCSHKGCVRSFCSKPECIKYCTKCSSCQQKLCSSHAVKCGNCNLEYCENHAKEHTSPEGTLMYCWKNKHNGSLHAPDRNIQNGVGTFVWPNGQRTMCWYKNGTIVLQQLMTTEEQCSAALTEEKEKFAEQKERETSELKEKLKFKREKFDRKKKKETEEFEAQIKDERLKLEQEKNEQLKMLQTKREDMEKEREIWQTSFHEEKQKWEEEKKQSKAEIEEEREKKLKDLEQPVLEKQQALNVMQEKLQKDIEDFEKEKVDSAKFILDQKGPIKLNIGGTKYETTISNLTKFPSMLSAMFSGRYEIEKDDKSAVFIDRDGTYFRHILNFLRDGTLPSKLSPEVVEALSAEANYYQLDQLVSTLENIK